MAGEHHQDSINDDNEPLVVNSTESSSTNPTFKQKLALLAVSLTNIGIGGSGGGGVPGASPLVDLGGASQAHATPYGTQFFCFRIHFH